MIREEKRPVSLIPVSVLLGAALCGGCVSMATTPWHAATADNVPKLERALLENGNIDAPRPKNGMTPLHYAVRYESFDAIRYLLAKGAAVNVKDKKGATPLHTASAALRSSKVAGMLLDAGADIDARDNREQTPLHYAVRHLRPAQVKLLLFKGADPKLRNSDGKDAFEELRGFVGVGLGDVHKIVKRAMIEQYISDYQAGKMSEWQFKD